MNKQKQFIERARRRLGTAIEGPWARRQQLLLTELLSALGTQLQENPLADADSADQRAFDITLSRLLCSNLVRELDLQQQLRQLRQRFETQASHLHGSTETSALLLDYSARLGASAAQLRRDRRALRRSLDVAALNERQAALLAASQRRLRFVLERSTQLLKSVNQDGHVESLKLEVLCQRLLQEPLPELLLVDCLALLTVAFHRTQLPPWHRRWLLEAALDTERSIWVQRAALLACTNLLPTQADELIETRLTRRAGDPDLFLRAAAVSLWHQRVSVGGSSPQLARTIARDPAPWVRQRLAEHIARSPALPLALQIELLTDLLLDSDPAVRGVALLTLCELQQLRPNATERLRDLLLGRLRVEQQDFPLRCALRAMESLATQLMAHPLLQARGGALLLPLMETLADRHSTDPTLHVRRWCAAARERIVVVVEPGWSAALSGLRSELRTSTQLDLRALPQALEATTWMRLLAVIAQRGEHLDVEPGTGHWTVTTGHRFGFRLWRVLHEWRNPSPDKRQGFRHTIGRRFSGRYRAPSGIMAEVSQTRVPGEPLIIADEDGWRPYLPLVDEFIDALDQADPSQPQEIFSAEGITRIEPPRGLVDQLKAWWQLSWRYADFAELRNWKNGSTQDPATYLDRLRALGFKVTFEAHTDPLTERPWQDPSVARFFQANPAATSNASTTAAGQSIAVAALAPLALLPWANLRELWSGFRQHAVSAYENSLPELAAFITLLTTLFFGQHLWHHWRFRQARAALPLVVGGWGTRGKSGTERLKAAMFTGAGYSVFSKTTGCEAMFVTNRAFRPLKELFLFRPYDKATIWEQANMVRLAARLHTDVFLWECMGLTPSYVRVLQQDWMRDDLSTITNTFPDHEDLQGPAGINIPEVMGEFIPRGSQLITTEEKMLPLLARNARSKDTALFPVDWYAIGALTNDVLARFPYEEHPHNIALVQRLGALVNIDRDHALKEMADQVVLDLGVLRTYPTATVANRRLTFVMGMSANERFGALGNWQRMGFAEATVTAAPERWTATLVNNRADRVSRSQIFAKLLIEDIAVDQNILIGSNLKGLVGYLHRAWQAYTTDLTLWADADIDNEAALARLKVFAQQRKVAVDEAELESRLAALCGPAADLGLGQGLCLRTLRQRFGPGQAPPFDHDTQDWGQRLVDETLAFQNLAERVRDASVADRPRINEAVTAQLWQWFNDRLLVVADPDISGEALTRTLAAAVPPQLDVRIMGMQNIKGTGLDFVYCWQAWDQIYLHCEALAGGNAAAMNAALDALLALPELGCLGIAQLERSLSLAAERAESANETLQAKLQQLRNRLRQLPAIGLTEAEQPTTQLFRLRQTLWQAGLAGLEGLLDAGDAVKRRRQADRVYADLAQGLIGEDRAIAAIKALNKRQKGGWLKRSLRG